MRSDNVKRTCLLLAWLITLAALIVTLYASEILKFAVCHLCWYQRICIYPLTIILAIAAFRDDFRIWVYALPLTLLGGLFAFYQYLQQMIPGFAPIELCGTGPTCSATHIQWFGFVTYPFLSMVACVAIGVLLVMSRA